MDPIKQAGRLLELAEAVSQHERAFDMGTWGTLRTYDEGEDQIEREVSTVGDLLEGFRDREPVTCGTTACLAGWAVALWPQEALAEGDDKSVEAMARQILGYDAFTIRNLFESSAPWQTAEEAALELRRRAKDLLVENVLDATPGDRVYVLEVRVEAPDEKDMPDADELAAGIAEGLSSAWYDAEEGEPFAIVAISG